MRRGKLTVLKVGGRVFERHLAKLPRALKRYLTRNACMIVHGGGKEVTRFCEERGLRARFVRGRRFTDERTMEAVELVLSGQINPRFVAELGRSGIRALGLSGRTASCIVARAVPSLGRVGLPRTVKSAFLFSLLELGQVPVFSSVAADSRGQALNVNADEMASALARAVKASRLIFLTDVPGVLDQEGNTIPHIHPDAAGRLISQNVVSGGMIPKLESALLALKKGVEEIWILKGEIPLSRSSGTVISKRLHLPGNPFI